MANREVANNLKFWIEDLLGIFIFNSMQAHKLKLRYGRLKVIRILDKNKHGELQIECQCKCGKVKITTFYNLRKNKCKSCGCLRHYSHLKHGYYRSAEYFVFNTIRQRCNNPKASGYHRYGGRGIKCLWKSFEEFIQDMGRRPSLKHSIGRLNNDGHYCKKNCEWQTSTQQAINTSQNKILAVDNEYFTLNQTAKKVGVSASTLHRKIKNNKEQKLSINGQIITIIK